MNWCQGGDDWGDENNANFGEENDNSISNMEKVSDEDDESYSFEELIRMGVGTLTVDDPNANRDITQDSQGKFYTF